MPFPSSRVGLWLTPGDSELTVRRILAYSAALGASEPAFLDDAASGGLRGLPFQCVSAEWPVVLSMRELLGDVLTPQEARRGVHAVQDSVFHRPARPGERLETTGQIVGAREIPSGVLATCRLETLGAALGDLITTSWTRSVYRGVALDGVETSIAEPPALPPGLDTALPADAEDLEIPTAREMPHIYSECAEIWNPIHTERAVAKAAGLPDIILHGTATWGLAGLAILRRYAERDVVRMKRLSGRFAGMVMAGERLQLRMAPLASTPGTIRFEMTTETGALAVRDGVAVLVQDDGRELSD